MGRGDGSVLSLKRDRLFRGGARAVASRGLYLSVEGYWFSKSVPYPPRPGEREGNDELSPLGAFSRGSTLVRSLLAARLHVTRPLVGPALAGFVDSLARSADRSIDRSRARAHSSRTLSSPSRYAITYHRRRRTSVAAAVAASRNARSKRNETKTRGEKGRKRERGDERERERKRKRNRILREDEDDERFRWLSASLRQLHY